MFTRPDDLPEAVLAGALRDGWGFTPVSLEYQAVGFGSHHWLATDARGGRVFATVDDLTARLRTQPNVDAVTVDLRLMLAPRIAPFPLPALRSASSGAGAARPRFAR